MTAVTSLVLFVWLLAVPALAFTDGAAWQPHLIAAGAALDDGEPRAARRHLETALALNRLAQLHQSQGDLQKAEPLFRRALAIYRTSLGPGHTHVGTLHNNLAELLHQAGRPGAAAPHDRRAIEIWTATLGAEHRYTATARRNLARLLRESGRPN